MRTLVLRIIWHLAHKATRHGQLSNTTSGPTHTRTAQDLDSYYYYSYQSSPSLLPQCEHVLHMFWWKFRLGSILFLCLVLAGRCSRLQQNAVSNQRFGSSRTRMYLSSNLSPNSALSSFSCCDPGSTSKWPESRMYFYVCYIISEVQNQVSWSEKYIQSSTAVCTAPAVTKY